MKKYEMITISLVGLSRQGKDKKGNDVFHGSAESIDLETFKETIKETGGDIDRAVQKILNQ